MSGIHVIGPELGAISAAVVFAGAMAFEGGTDRVPGVARGDVVPAMLTPGEGVVPGGVMDNLRTMSRNGGFDNRPTVTLHYRPTFHVQTIDGDGVRGMLEEHSKEFSRHFEGELRKMNR